MEYVSSEGVSCERSVQYPDLLEVGGVVGVSVEDPLLSLLAH